MQIGSLGFNSQSTFKIVTQNFELSIKFQLMLNEALLVILFDVKLNLELYDFMFHLKQCYYLQKYESLVKPIQWRR